MPKRMERTDFSQCEESKRRKAIVEQQIDNNLPTSSVEEDLVRILYYLMALYLWFVSNSFPHFTALSFVVFTNNSLNLRVIKQVSFTFSPLRYHYEEKYSPPRWNGQ